MTVDDRVIGAIAGYGPTVSAGLARAADEVAATLGGVRGTVTVGMIPTFTAFDVVDVLRTYRAAYPDATVRLRSGASETLIEDVRTGTVDLALLGVPDGFSTAGVVARRLAVDHLVLVVPEAERVDGPLTLAATADRPFADYPAGGAGRAESDQAFERAGVRRTVAFEMDRSETMLELIAAGLCVGTAARETVPDGAGLGQGQVASPRGRQGRDRVPAVVEDRGTHGPEPRRHVLHLIGPAPLPGLREEAAQLRERAWAAAGAAHQRRGPGVQGRHLRVRQGGEDGAAVGGEVRRQPHPHVGDERDLGGRPR